MQDASPFTVENMPLMAVRADHHCFGCGALNPIGLHLTFTDNDHGVEAPFTPTPAHQGFENVVHGGIISAVLDEAMAWATAAAGIWAVTGEIRVRFRKPLHVGDVTVVTAAVDAKRGRLVATSASLVAKANGREFASATATFMRVDAATESAWRARYLSDETAHPPVAR